jgi:uncharacterized YigZ family protein
MKDSFFTLKHHNQALFKEKGSKFLSYAFSVSSEEEIKSELEKLRKQYYDATHHCYAYMLGAEGKNFRANDDGEPAHSAGTPILNQIRSSGLSDVLVVVVRYYGGTKLGVSGLISAYKTAAILCLENAEKTEKIIKNTSELRFGFELMNPVMRVIKEFDADILSQDFEDLNILRIAVRLRDFDRMMEKLKEIRGLDITPV